MSKIILICFLSLQVHGLLHAIDHAGENNNTCDTCVYISDTSFVPTQEITIFEPVLIAQKIIKPKSYILITDLPYSLLPRAPPVKPLS